MNEPTAYIRSAADLTRYLGASTLADALGQYAQHGIEIRLVGDALTVGPAISINRRHMRLPVGVDELDAAIQVADDYLSAE